MKKAILALLLLIVLALVAIYLFIPAQINISQSQGVQANQEALSRKIANPQTWDEWWPANLEDQKQTKPGAYILNGIVFKPVDIKLISVLIANSGKINTESELTLIPLELDSTLLQLHSTIATGYNPFVRVAKYMASKKLEKNFTEILQSISNRYSKAINLYGYDIQRQAVIDSTLIFTFENMKGYPSMNQVYNLIDRLRDYAKLHSAKETGYPMLNIFTPDSINYLVKVAIPVDKKLPPSGNISYKWMLGGGNILIAEVKGGQHQINKAHQQVLYYISDHQRKAPAIPFESLVTDRRQEPDSNKWVTRVYYPVM